MNKNSLTFCNLSKDLLNQKEIKPVETHKKKNTAKSILKGSQSTNTSKVISNSSTSLGEVKRPTSSRPSNISSPNEAPEIKPSSFYVVSEKNNNLPNHHNPNQNPNNPYMRPSSVDTRDRNQNNPPKNSYTNNQNNSNNLSSNFMNNNSNDNNYNASNLNDKMNESGAKVINFQNFITTNINNFYVQPNTNIPELEYKEYKKENISNRDSKENRDNRDNRDNTNNQYYSNNNSNSNANNKYYNNFINPVPSSLNNYNSNNSNNSNTNPNTNTMNNSTKFNNYGPIQNQTKSEDNANPFKSN